MIAQPREKRPLTARSPYKSCEPICSRRHPQDCGGFGRESCSVNLSYGQRVDVKASLGEADGRGPVRASQAATPPSSVPQCLHLVAAGSRSSDRHAGQVLVGAGSPNTVLPSRAITVL